MVGAIPEQGQIMDLFEAAEESNAPEFTVSELTGSVKKTLEGAFGRVRVRGEIGRVITAKSGHMYYDIKDERNVIACNTWKGQVSALGVRPEEGLEVIVTGRLSTFGPQSKYNINVDSVEVAGEGALMAMLEKRRKALAGEGLFDEDRKAPLPYLPGIIGVVTSPTGAVIRDILHRLRDRFPSKVLVWPVAVQGKNCAPEVVAAIKGFNALTPGGALPRPDLIIVARGGGSLEDLWGFNEEAVVRAAAASDIPLISAVGHETDTTLIDFASDRRAPTPTAAAEIAVPVRMDLVNTVDGLGGRLTRALTGGVDARRQRLRDLSRALPRSESLLDGPRQRLDTLSMRLPNALQSAVDRKRIKLANLRLSPGQIRAGVVSDRRRLTELSARLPLVLGAGIERRRRDLNGIRLPANGMRQAVQRDRQAFEKIADRLTPDLMQARFLAAQQRLTALDRMRQTLGYTETLRRGYAVVRDDGALVTDVASATAATTLEIEFADGRVVTKPNDIG